MKNPYFDQDIQELLAVSEGIVLVNDKMSDLAVSFLVSITQAPTITAMTMIAIWDTTVVGLIEDVPPATRLYYNQATNTLFLALIERLFPATLHDIGPLFASTRIALGVVNATR